MTEQRSVTCWNATERRFAARAVARRRVFLALSALGVVVGLSLAAWYGVRWWRGDGEGAGSHTALVVLILLNARQNLRQYRYAALLERLGPD